MRLCIAGPGGSGKTYTALAVASGVGDKIAVVDTEGRRASIYADVFDFHEADYRPPYTPERFIDAIDIAESNGFDVLIIDCLTHEYHGVGGLLEIVDKAKPKYGGNDWAAWNEGTPRHRRLMDRIVNCDLHVICTVRTKTEYVLIEKNGRQVPTKVGMELMQRPGIEYQFDVVLMLDMEHRAHIDKQRLGLEEKPYVKPGPEFGQIVLRKLDGKKPPTQDELWMEAVDADNLYTFISIAHEISGVSDVLETQARLTDWYGYVVGEYQPALNATVLEALKKYISQVGSGRKVRDAAQSARSMIRQAQSPLTGNSDTGEQE